MTGQTSEQAPAAARARTLTGYGEAVAAVVAATGVSWAMFPLFEQANLVMIYLLATVVIGARHGRGPSVLASVASVGAFDFFFVPPHLTFAVADTQYLLTFSVMLVVALVIGGLTARIRLQAEATRGLALERVRLADEAQEARLRAEGEHLRSSLLASVSHDLRTPLAAITGAATTMLERGPRLPPGTQRELLESIRDEADRLNRLVQNLLEMTRLQAGALQLRPQWHPLEEVVGAALGRMATPLGARRVDVALPAELPLVAIDDVLVEQVFVNLLDNAIKYAPPDGPIRIAAEAGASEIIVQVSNLGPALGSGEEERIFDPFYRAAPGDRRSRGLGLAICRGIVRAHGGRIWAENLPGGGVAFRFTLPLGDPPAVALPVDA